LCLADLCLCVDEHCLWVGRPVVLGYSGL
jgi:hypothetical protein